MAGRKPRAAAEADREEQEAELQARVDARVKELFQQLAAEASDKPDTGISGLMSDLVVAMKKMSDPQSQKKHLSPEELRLMEEGREEMVRHIMEAHERNEWPRYRLTRKVYLAEQKIEPQVLDASNRKMVPQDVDWRGVPSEAMVPINEAARKIHAAFMKSIHSRSVVDAPRPGFVLHGKEVLRTAPGEERGDDLPTGDNLRVLGTVAPAFKANSDARMQDSLASLRQ